MKDLSLIVFSDLKDDGIESIADPANRQKLLGSIGASIKPIRPREQFARFLKTYASARILSQTFAFSLVEAKAHLM